MTDKPEINILLAVYNGEEFLKEQIDSILSQTYDRWNLIIRDDGSGDNTLDIINNYIDRYPDKIKLLEDGKKHSGIHQNFSKLLANAEKEYIMFSDQDDVWLPQKIERTLMKMKELEEKYGKDLPLLVHTDLKVADKNLNILSSSFWRYQNLDPRKSEKINRLLVQNVITGCSVMINKRLKNLVLPVPQDAIMHDWWIGLVATAFGKIAHIDTPTLLYRQHGKNDTGAKNWGTGYMVEKLLNFKEIKEGLLRTQKQAKVFLDRYKNMLSEEDIYKISIYSSLSSMGFWKRRFYILKYGFFKIGIIRNIGLFLCV